MSSINVSPEQLLREAKAFRAKKHLGQHFLIDDECLHKVVQSLDLQPKDRVLEIGPGLGFLTRILNESDIDLTAVELDSDCVEQLQKMNYANTTIVHGDFLNYNLNELGAPRRAPTGGLKSPRRAPTNGTSSNAPDVAGVNAADKIKVVGNVPYQITAPILRHVLGEIGSPSDWLAKIDRLVMTIQAEVAYRFIAEPGTKDYSQITLLVNYFCHPEIIELVPSESFFPAPEVTSAIVRLRLREKPAVESLNPGLLRKVIKSGFSQRRKMLKNNLESLLPAKQLSTIFSDLNFDPQVRAERLSLPQFAMLTDAVHTQIESAKP